MAMMDSREIDRALDELSDRIRRARQGAGLSLADFGKRCGLSPSAIQKIENKSMSPSIAVVMKIAGGLGVHVGDLLSPPEPVDADIVILKAGAHPSIPGAEGMQSLRLSSAVPGSELEAWRMVVAANSHFVMASPQRSFEQIVVCEAGSITLELDQVTYALQAGDTLHCVDKALYSCANTTSEPATYLLFGKFPHGPPRSRILSGTPRLTSHGA
jgi:transcriptional regulator with XRE-family HTH domain